MNIKKFLSIEKDLAQKNSLEISLTDPSHEIVSHYLRAWRGRSDLSKIVSHYPTAQSKSAATDFTNLLNEVRRLIRGDELDSALRLINSYENTIELEKAELELERTRVSLFKGEYADVISISDPLLKNMDTPETTRMTLHQVRGIAKIYSGHPSEALEELNQALTIAATFKTAPSAFAALTVKSQAFSCLKNQEKANDCLRLAESILDNTIDIDVWLERQLSFLRAQVRYHQFFSSEDCFLKSASIARCIAVWLEAKVVVRLCDIDLAGRTCDPVSYKFLGGQYIPELKIILTDHPKSVTSLQDSPQAAKIIELLCQKDMAKPDLFENVWGYKYNDSIHNPHLRNTLSRLRKYLPEGTLVSSNTIVSLKK